MTEFFKFDAFLSHNSKDKPFVEALAKRLEDEMGFNVWLDKWDLAPGDLWQEAIEKALGQCRTYVVFLGPSGIGPWHHQEMRLALSTRAIDPKRRVIPVLLPESNPDNLTDLPGFLSQLTWVDFRKGLDDQSTFRRLVAGIKGVPPGRDDDLPVQTETTERVYEPLSPPTRKQRRIDAAVPSRTEVGQHIDLLIQVRFPDSPLLGIKDWPVKRRPSSIEQTSESVPLEFPVDRRTGELKAARLEVRVVAPDFKVEGETKRLVEIPPYQYSKRILFLLTAKKAGNCRINAEVYSTDHIHMGTIPVETSVGEVAITQTVNVANFWLIVNVTEQLNRPYNESASLDIAQQNDIKKLIVTYNRRLQKLKEQKAKFGINTPPEILIEIDIELEIAELKTKLRALDNQPQPSQPQPFQPPPSSPPKPPKPSWILDLPVPPPILQSSQISTLLREFDPFSKDLSEHDLGILFGQVGGFWSWHPIYSAISANFFPEVVVTETGMGKTAFAHALIQVGDVNGNPLERTLPIFVAGHQATRPNIRSLFTNALLNFVGLNPSLLAALHPGGQELLIGFLVHGLGIAQVKARLQDVFPKGQNFDSSAQQSNKNWLPSAHECLRLLGFERALLAIDFNRQNTENAQACLEDIQQWADHAIIVKLFLPSEETESLTQYLNRFQTQTLSWTDQQIAQMADWRLESLSILANIRITLETLFDDDLYPQFITQAQCSPRRLAQLWRILYEDYLHHNPQRRAFSADNLKRAVEKLK